MIATTISGGIGNQLFMYAAARAMALRKGTGLVVNIETGFKEDKEFNRCFELDCFNIKYEHNRKLTFQFPYAKYLRKISKIIKHHILSPNYYYLADSTGNTGIDDKYFYIKGNNIYLDGYWQSEEYFKDFETELRKDLTFNFPLSNSIKKTIDIIFNNPTKTPVCMGVRRYQEVKHALNIDICGKDFYLKAMDYIKKIVDNPIFYVFTQDKEWAKKELLNNDTYIEILPELKTSEDLLLMSKFKYHIISNSSYYWWGAWLANGQIVVTTDKFKNKRQNCRNWIVL